MPKTKSFVLSTQAMNTKRLVIPTASISLSAFSENPIMLYNHTRGQVIGRWENVRVENDQLLGDPVFDEEDELGAKIKGKVERGFIKAASIGIRKVYAQELQDNEGKYYRVTSCELREASIVDIPANTGALRLLDESDKEIDLSSVVELSDVIQVQLLKKPTMEKKKIASALGLADDAEESTILAAVQEGVQAKKDLETFRTQQKAAQKIKAVALADAAVADGRLQKESREKFIKLADSDYELFEETISSLPKPVRLSDVSKSTSVATTAGRESWTFSDYQKKDPKALSDLHKADPDKFKELYRSEYGEELED